MKKILFFGLLALLSGSCTDTGHNYTSYYVYINDSDHKITLSAMNYADFYIFDGEELWPGDNLKLARRSPESWNPPTGFMRLLIASFDDGEYVVSYGKPLIPNDDDIYLPALDEESYVFEELGGDPREASWTYTFTDADYDAAVAAYEEKESR